MGVVVVVPALAAGEQRDPPTVAGVVVSFKAAAAPHVGCGVDEPGGVQAKGYAEQAPQRNMARPLTKPPQYHPRESSSTALTVMGSQWYLLIQTWKRSRLRSGE